LQTTFYPSGFPISNVYLDVTTQVNNCTQERNDCPWPFTFNSQCGCCESIDTLFISTTIGAWEKYVIKYKQYLLRSSDYSFYKTLSEVTNKDSTSANLVLRIKNVTSKFDFSAYPDSLLTLFTWVRLKKDEIHLYSFFM